MKMLVLSAMTLFFGSALVAGCDAPPADDAAPALTTAYAQHEVSSVPAGDGIHTNVTLLSDGAQVATLDWSSQTGKVSYQPVDGEVREFTLESSAAPSPSVENSFAAALVGEAQSAAAPEKVGGGRIDSNTANCYVVTLATPNWSCVWECATCNGQPRGCTSYGPCTL